MRCLYNLVIRKNSAFTKRRVVLADDVMWRVIELLQVAKHT